MENLMNKVRENKTLVVIVVALCVYVYQIARAC